MPQRRFHLEVPTLAEVPARVLAECGPYAEVISAEKVTVGGIGGFLARRHYEVVVVVPDAPRDGAHVLDREARVGIEALLADADDVESQLYGQAAEPSPSPPAPPSVSTSSAQFDQLMDSLDFSPVRLPRPIELMTAPGDLVALVGLGGDCLQVTQSIASDAGGAVYTAGTVTSGTGIHSRRDALGVRADGVRAARPSFLAYGIGTGRSGIEEHGRRLASLEPDQVWVVVDVGRKPDDTAAWVSQLAGVIPVYAVAVLGNAATATPESVDALGLPIGWAALG